MSVFREALKNVTYTSWGGGLEGQSVTFFKVVSKIHFKSFGVIFWKTICMKNGVGSPILWPFFTDFSNSGLVFFWSNNGLVFLNKHFKILVRCSEKEGNCIQGHETSCKLMKLPARSWNFMQAYGTSCKSCRLSEAPNICTVLYCIIISWCVTPSAGQGSVIPSPDQGEN